MTAQVTAPATDPAATQAKQKPWYKEPYVWLIIFFPLSAVIAGIITTWLAVISYDGLVIDDYYKYGLQINKVLNREKAANVYGLKAIVMTNNDNGKFRVLLQSNEKFRTPETIDIQFLHPTRDGHDQAVTLTRTTNEIFEGELPYLIPGNWYLQISAEDWRLIEYYPVL